VKAFTERRPKPIGLIGMVIILAGVLAILFFNRSFFNSGYDVTARFPNAAGITKGSDVLVAGVPVGTVTAVKVHGNSVDTTLSVNHSVQLPQHTAAAIEVETLLGVVDVTLEPISGWQHPLRNGALITDTSVPTELYQLQNEGQKLLSASNTKALNSLVESLATITAGKQTQVAEIIKGLGALTSTVDQRSGQVSQLIDSANTLSSTLTAKDQELLSIIDNLNTVSTGLADHSSDLASLIANVDQMATQTNALVSGDTPALNGLLASLHSDLSVVGAHQDDLAEGVSYLAGAIKGFASIGYAGNQEVDWGNIFANPAGLTNTYSILGCNGVLDIALSEALGPDPDAGNCAAQEPSSGPAQGVSPASGSTSGSTPNSNSTSGTTGTSAGGLPTGPNSGLGGLTQLLAPLLAGIK
jgi:phospholipid/cholesterol/gamma-HCH transport system substrate-binding protein